MVMVGQLPSGTLETYIARTLANDVQKTNLHKQMRLHPLQIKIDGVLMRRLRLKAIPRRNGRLIRISSELRQQLLVEFMAESRAADQAPSTLGSVVLVGDGGIASVELGEILGICAEAPLPRVLIKQQNLQLDGVGGMASMLKQSNLPSIVFCPSGHGTISSLEKRLLGKEQIAHFPLHSSLQRISQCTRHVLAGSHHLAHFVNQETIAAESAHMVTRSIKALKRVLKKAGLLCIIDRGEGGLDSRTLEAILASAKESKVPVIYDAKSENLIYNSALDVIKINQDQIRRWFGVDDESDEAALKAAELVRVKSGAGCVVYTRRTQGILVTGASGKRNPAFLIRPREKRLFDLVSVGDIVTAALVFCLARQCSVLHAACFAATAAEFGLDRRYEKHFDLRVLLNH